MDAELKSLRIERSRKERKKPSRFRVRWLGIALVLIGGAVSLVLAKLNAAPEVRVIRVVAAERGPGAEGSLILNATGYIVAAHKIELASKVVGRVAWIGVEKGDKVKRGQVLVRLEDDEYRARVQEALGQVNYLKTRLEELQNGSRPQEITRAQADLDETQAELEDAQVAWRRARQLAGEGVLSRQALDDATAKYDAQRARFVSLEKTYDLVRIGPRREEIEGTRAQIQQAEGELAYARTQLENTVIRAPISGTILERNVEKGEFVTTGFVGDKGAKGYVVSLADLSDLQVELDIGQSDFAKLSPTQLAIVTTDAYPDRKYKGHIEEISPEANRQKATVQVKVKIDSPDAYLRPEMNASVAFVSKEKAGQNAEARSHITIPNSAVREGGVFIVVGGKATRRTVQVSGATPQGTQVTGGLIAGEDLVVNPPADLKDGQKVHISQGERP